MDNQNELKISSQLEFICPTEQAPEETQPLEYVVANPQEQARQAWIEVMDTKNVRDTPSEINRILYHDVEFVAYSPKHNIVLARVKDHAIMRFSPQQVNKCKTVHFKPQNNPAVIAEYLQNRLANSLTRELSLKLRRPVRVQFYAGKIGPDYMQPRDRLTEECWWDAILSGLGVADPAPLVKTSM